MNSRGVVEAEVDDQGRYVYKSFDIDGDPEEKLENQYGNLKLVLNEFNKKAIILNKRHAIN